MRGWAARLAAACLALVAPAAGLAQSWQPSKPVEIVVPTTPGGGMDRLRAAAENPPGNGLVKVPVNVINKPGGGGAVSVSYINLHAGDAHYRRDQLAQPHRERYQRARSATPRSRRSRTS